MNKEVANPEIEGMETASTEIANQDLIELFDVKTIKAYGSYRWLGKARLAGYPKGRTMVVLEINGDPIAFPNPCPHEGAELAYGKLVDDYVIECPLHYNTYHLWGNSIQSYKVVLREEKMYILRDSL